MTQYYFLDESGDPGQQSTPYFALAMVQLAAHQPIPELAALRAARHLAPAFEFKFHKTTATQRQAFFQSVQPLTFRVRAAVVDKRCVPDLGKGPGQEFIADWTAALILRASELDLANDVLVMDGAVPSLRRALRLRLSEACRDTGRVRPFAKIISADSQRDDGLQLADMIVGAVRQAIVAKDRRYLDTFSEKVIDLWQAPCV